MQPMDDGSTTSTPLSGLSGYATMAQLQAAVVGYTTVSPTSGATVAMPANRGVLLLQGGTLLAALTVLLPPNPTDGQVARIASQMAVTVLTVKDAAGNAVTGGSLALGVFGVGALWQFQGSAWVRIG
ncbi:hypothetical protein NFI95_15470 [Acetobacteraceae bacterium KSS8]|uniref:Uncharacterized protein n=1 Tax=Endosaccharibacter trunci TaxID=2812733 RepID=A0ABT1WDF6_9PROT|nr:hypothetical protein [Acetobacteraceae bacterium KSS8]